MSSMDLEIAISVPPGGNWKNVPTSIPSKRIERIRKDFEAGLGSRSTYYGRLHPDKPSYTINTYFTRPGNGCHLHYDYANSQHRTLSFREAARLQSFPDNFHFVGSKTSVANQIGNAVPALLAFQIAASIGTKGCYVDLFSGCGGLSLGFKWAGWKPIVANDIDKDSLETYKSNIHDSVLVGDIRDEDISGQILKFIKDHKKNCSKPLWVIGGPPCQGFSTAGNSRSSKDPRNQLVNDYIKLLQRARIDGFVFENVTGILSMEQGAVIDTIQSELTKLFPNTYRNVLKAEEFGVPQRRTRVILIGDKGSRNFVVKPINKGLKSGLGYISVAEAIGDLPLLTASEDGSSKKYRKIKLNRFQQFVRGEITPQELLKGLL
jgi:DNA (cytosine-5)-methyltransferase 1